MFVKAAVMKGGTDMQVSWPKRILYWAPRVLGVLFAAFISLFAFDVLGTGSGFWPTLGALAIHLIPTALVLLALLIAWRREWIGSLLFLALGIGYFWMTGLREHWSAYLIITGPLLLEAALLLANWYWRRELRPGM